MVLPDMKKTEAMATRCTSRSTDMGRICSAASRRITADVLGRFGELLSDGLRSDNRALRQAYARLLIDEVIVGIKRFRPEDPKRPSSVL